MRRAGLALLSALLCCGCAQVREISGGPKDEEGPILEEASPPSGTVRFAGDRFVMLFDERVQVNRPKGGLLVSPPMDPPPTISVSGAREVTVSWKNELRPNTTYSFAIGEAVQDLSERNPARGLTYALSTGDAVDSLSVTGTVTLTGEIARFDLLKPVRRGRPSAVVTGCKRQNLLIGPYHKRSSRIRKVRSGPVLGRIAPV